MRAPPCASASLLSAHRRLTCACNQRESSHFGLFPPQFEPVLDPSSCLTSAARCGGVGAAWAAYWSLRHFPTANTPTHLPARGMTLLLRGMGSVAVLNYMRRNPVIDLVGC